MFVTRIFGFLFQIIYTLLILRVIFSFLKPDPFRYRTLFNANKFIFKITEPFLSPIRNLVSPITVGGGGYIDLSPLIALLILNLLQRILFSFSYLL
ncbi:YggT family protein [Natranaerobius trueperi]|uniref:YggT family protein n=1 Tax=Natranaerobius trueperi TaxID=759412 RepID=A0A226BYZ1_9FIRM|nr:YggT family protein [Natranaerobius trueperi]OWZ84145.1 hypothetical protein CDO51_04555 [Natranaerobius trueperi]